MIRPYKSADKESLLKIFNLNIPINFDKNEINNFEEYIEQRADTYLTIEVDNNIVGGTGYYINENDKSGRITWIFFSSKLFWTRARKTVSGALLKNIK